jgi:hypothetical protein
VNGATKCLTEWARDIGISHATLIYRIKSGWPAELAVTLPKNGKYGKHIIRT